MYYTYRAHGCKRTFARLSAGPRASSGIAARGGARTDSSAFASIAAVAAFIIVVALLFVFAPGFAQAQKSPDAVAAVVSCSDAAPFIGEVVHFDASASYTDNGTITAYQFEFGDGEGTGWAVSPNATHSYSAIGTYRAQVRARNGGGAVSPWATIQINIENRKPSVRISSPSNGSIVSGAVSVTGSAEDADGSIQYVELEINGASYRAAPGNVASAWSFTWNSTSLPDGAYYITARSFDGTDYSGEDSVRVTVSNAGHVYSIAISGAPSSFSAYPKEQITVYGYVKYNTGDAAQGAPVSAKVFEYGTEWSAYTDMAGRFEIAISAPNNTGSYTITIYASSGDMSAQSSIPLAVSIRPLPDFSISADSIFFGNATSNNYSQTIIYVSIRNNGSVESLAMVAFYDGNPEAGGTLIDTDVVLVQPRSSSTASVRRNLSAGTHIIWAVADMGDQVEESNEQNNAASCPITIVQSGDLGIEAVLLSDSTPSVGDEVTLTIRISNNGGIPVNATLKLYDGRPSEGGVLVMTLPVNLSGLEAQMSANWNVTKSPQAVYALLTGASPGDSNPDNNGFYLDITPASAAGQASGASAVPFAGFPLFIAAAFAAVLLFRRRRISR